MERGLARDQNVSFGARSEKNYQKKTKDKSPPWSLFTPTGKVIEAHSIDPFRFAPSPSPHWIWDFQTLYGNPYMFFGLQVVLLTPIPPHQYPAHKYVLGSWNTGKCNKPLFRVQLNFNILNSILCVAFLSYLKYYNIKPRYQEEVTFLVKTGNVGQEKFVQHTIIYRVVTRIESCSTTLPFKASLFNALQTPQGL